MLPYCPSTSFIQSAAPIISSSPASCPHVQSPPQQEKRQNYAYLTLALLGYKNSAVIDRASIYTSI
jgi:hypothetical protein